jgi:hypothetical protein
MGWLYVFMGVIISSAVLPATLTLMWKGQNFWAATLSPILGLICSLTAWLVTTSKLNDGVINVATSGANNPMLAGNVVALLSPMIFIPVLTLIFGMGTLLSSELNNHVLMKDRQLRLGLHEEHPPHRRLGRLYCRAPRHRTSRRPPPRTLPRSRSRRTSQTASRFQNRQNYHRNHDARSSRLMAHAPLWHRLHFQREILLWLGHCWHHLVDVLDDGSWCVSALGGRAWRGISVACGGI